MKRTPLRWIAIALTPTVLAVLLIAAAAVPGQPFEGRARALHPATSVAR